MSVIPSDLSFTHIPASVNIKRIPVRANADTQSYSVNNKIQIQFANDFSDFRGSYLTFYAIAPLNGGTYVRFSYPIQTMFSRAQVYLGSTLIEDIDDFNVLQGLFKEVSSYDSVNNVGLEGYYLAATRATETNAGRLYTVRLRLESLERVWPLHKLKLPLRLVLTVADGSNFLEYDGSTPTVTINNMYMNFYIIQPDAAVDSVIDAAIQAGGMKVYFRSWDNYNTQVGTATNNTLLLPFKRRVVQSILAAWRDQADVTGVTVNGKFVDQFQAKGVISAYVRVLNQIFPADKYDMNFTSGYQMMSPVLNSIMEDTTHPFLRQQDTFSLQDIANRTVAAFDLRVDSSPGSQGLRNNGIDTSGSANSQSLGLTYSALTGALQYDVFARYECVVTILPNGNVVLDC